MRRLVLLVGGVLAVAVLFVFGVAGAGSVVPSSMLVFAGERQVQRASVAGLYLLRTDGSGLRELTTNAKVDGVAVVADDEPAWSPDGRQIAYSTMSSLVNAGEFVKWESGTIMVMASAGRGARQVTSPGPIGSEFLDSSPSWSPDGLSIAFARVDTYYQQKPGIYVVGADGKGLRKIAARAAVAVDWSSDGASVAFVAGSWDSGTDGRVGTIDLATGAVKTFPLAGAHDVSWAPGGRTLAVAGDRGISIVTPTGRQVRRIQTGGPAFGVSWSPDGQQLAYGATRNKRGYYIYVAAANGRNAKRITGKGGSWAPDWRP